MQLLSGGTFDGGRLEKCGRLQNISGYRNGGLDKLLLARWLSGSFGRLVLVDLIAGEKSVLFIQG